jgi:hypothetical protein
MSNDLLRVNTGVQDPFLWHTDHPITEPKPWSTTNMFVMDHLRVITPFESADGPEKVAKFALQKVGHCLLKVRLEFTITLTPTTGGAGNSVGAGNTIARFCDWIGKRILKRVELVYNTNSIQKLNGKQMFDESMLREEDEDFLEAIGDLEGGDLTASEREFLANGGAPVTATAGTAATYSVELPLFHTCDASYGLHVNALSHDPTLEIEFERAVSVIETDFLSATYTLSNLKLKCFYLNMTQEDKSHIVGEILQRKDGFMYMMLDHETQTKALASGSTSSSTEFTSIRGAVVELRWTLIRDAHYNTSTYENQLDAYEAISTFSLTGSGSDIVGHGSFTLTGNEILRYYMKQLFHPKAVHGARVYAMSFAFEPDHKIDRSGSLNFGKSCGAIRIWGTEPQAEGSSPSMTYFF